MRRTIVICLMVGLLSPLILKGQAHKYISPGIKLGYTFGPKGGFTFGLELSFIKWVNEEYMYGLVMDIDFCKDRKKFHVGGEIGYIYGIDLGPTIIWESDENNSDWGLTFTPYFGAIIPYLYLSYTYRFGKGASIYELGLFLKKPISVGEPWKVDF